MKCPKFLLIALLSASFLSITQPAYKTQYIEFLDSSSLYLEGSSNVTDFNCACKDDLEPLRLEMTTDKEEQMARFSDARIQIDTRSLDCGHKRMNKDLLNALQADEHPHIAIRLNAVRYKNGYSPDLCEEWVHMLAAARLTIAGQTRIVHLNIKGKKHRDGEFRFQSTVPIRMTQFGIDPPTALLGLVKVDDAITIHFDLLVAVEDIG